MLKTYGEVMVSGIAGVLTWPTQGAGSKATTTGQTSTHSWTEVATNRDPATGAVRGRIIVDEQREIQIEFVCTDAADPQAESVARGALIAPAPYAVMTITGGHLAGTYNYMGGWEIVESNGAEVKVRCTIRKMLDSGAATVAVLATEVTS